MQLKYACSPDGKQLAVVRTTTSSNVVVLSNLSWREQPVNVSNTEAEIQSRITYDYYVWSAAALQQELTRRKHSLRKDSWRSSETCRTR